MGIFDSLPQGLQSWMLGSGDGLRRAGTAFMDWRQQNMDALMNASPREQAMMLGTGFAGAGLRAVPPGPRLAPGGLPHVSTEAAAGPAPAEAAPAGGAQGNPVAPAPAAAGAGNSPGGGGFPPPPDPPDFVGPPDFLDPEGRQLRAQYIVGQRRPGGPDVPLSHDEMLEIARRLSQPQLGGGIEFHSPLIDAKGRRLFGDVGPVGGDVPPPGIDPHDAPLMPLTFRFDPDPHPAFPEQSRNDFRAIVPHELGHGLDDRMRNFDDVAVAPHLDPQDLEWISRHARPGHWAPGAASPEYLHRPTELMADSFSTYMTDPAWMRDRVPDPDPTLNPPMGQDVAKWIRDRMNTDPKTRDLIQFNQFAPLMLGGGGAGALLNKGND